MELGFSKALEKVKDKEYETINDLYKEAGMAMLNSMGGASGVIFSSMFLNCFRGQPPVTEAGVADFAAGYERALAAIKQRGKAEVGDKTMVDAFSPAVDAMKEAAEKGVELEEAFVMARDAAEKGMESTKNFQAKFGRAKSLLERAIGFQDAGATSVYLIFKFTCEYLAK